MKKTISLMICLFMIISVFSSCQVVKVQGEKTDIDLDDIFTDNNISVPDPYESENTPSEESTTTDSGQTVPPETTTVTTTPPETTTVTTTPPETTTVTTTPPETTTVTTIPPETTTVATVSPDTENKDDDYPYYYDYVAGNHGVINGNTIYNHNATYFYDIRENAKQYKANTYSALWLGTNENKKPTEVYSPEKALEFASYHWNDGLDLCAPFISRCLRAGQISAFSDSSTGLCMQLLDSGLGFGQFLPINEDRTVTLPDYAMPGDVIQVYCPYEGLMIHSLMLRQNDKDGHMMVYCHNFRNDGSTTFYVDELCYDDDVFTNEVFFYHFYNEKDKNLPKEVTDSKTELILFENEGYCLKEKYNRTAAMKYAADNLYDGLGMLGAIHLSDCLVAGGIPVYYAQGNAVFFQLMKSRLGTAQTVNINEDGTINLPKNAKGGDVCFIYCPYDGMMVNSFLIKSKDKNGKLIGYTVDLVNDGKKAFVADDYCIGCGSELPKAVIFSFK